jgi:hypothetical protein
MFFSAVFAPPPQVTLCPSFVIGPMLNGATGTLNTSLRVMQDVMKANVPFVPKMGLPLVDVEWQWGGFWQCCYMRIGTGCRLVVNWGRLEQY